MKNIGLVNLEKANVDNFTTETGIKLRRTINKATRAALKLATNGKIILEDYPKLEKGKPYIFASTHSFVEEVSALLATIDRSVYTLCGTTDQFENNPKMYFNWLTGIIFVDRYSEESRKSAIPKMERILNSGTSVLLFPEGGFNNSENLIVEKLFAGPYLLSKNTNIEVVPLSTFNDFGQKDIYISASEPLKLYKFDKREALTMLRDALATMKYKQIENHTTRINRREMPEDPRLSYMEERKAEYLKTKWTRDVWEEELTVYKDKNYPSPTDVRKELENVNITSANCNIMGPILSKRLEDKKYDFKEYMHNNWNK